VVEGALLPAVGPLGGVLALGAVPPLADPEVFGAVAREPLCGGVVADLADGLLSASEALWLWKLSTPARPAAVALMTSG
jgi:hypothetical protein